MFGKDKEPKGEHTYDYETIPVRNNADVDELNRYGARGFAVVASVVTNDGPILLLQREHKAGTKIVMT